MKKYKLYIFIISSLLLFITFRCEASNYKNLIKWKFNCKYGTNDSLILICTAIPKKHYIFLSFQKDNLPNYPIPLELTLTDKISTFDYTLIKTIPNVNLTNYLENGPNYYVEKKTSYYIALDLKNIKSNLLYVELFYQATSLNGCTPPITLNGFIDFTNKNLIFHFTSKV